MDLSEHPPHRASDPASGDEPRHRASDWLSLGEASALLGIAPKTLRRWSDDGRVPVLLTAGGHRRFARGVVENLVASFRPSQPQRSLADALRRRLHAATRRERMELRALLGTPGVARTSSERHVLRVCAAGAFEGLVHYMAGRGDDADAALNDALGHAREFGRQLGQMGVSIEPAARAYGVLQATIARETLEALRERGPSGRDPALIIALASEALGRFLVAALDGYADGRGTQAESRTHGANHSEDDASEAHDARQGERIEDVAEQQMSRFG